MPTRFKRSFTPQTVDRDGVSLAQTTGGAASLTITGALASGGAVTFTTPCHVSIYSGGDIHTRTFTVTGTDRYGAALSEAVTGPNNSTVATVANFKTVTAVAVDGTVGTNVEVGSSSGSETPWIPLDASQLTSIAVDVSSNANFTYALQYTYDNPYLGEAIISGIFTDSTMTAKTADFDVSLAKVVAAVRLSITSYVAGSLVLTGRQSPAG